ncbi:MAG: NAD-dependent epimerase/dehydratase family protein [Thermoanaerobaculales bacterium]|nr:NAD-dependent epimerase/dehydratase family protein [Thermoanaerobaculales bacterium]
MNRHRRVLVTGGAGFIGSHLSDAILKHGFEVTILDNLHTGIRGQVPAGADFIEGDVRDSDAVARAFETEPEIVCHLAGQASIRLAWADPSADLAVNVEGTLRILAACREHRVPRLLYASSMTVYGNPDEIPTSEDAPARPVAHYGITKFAAERYVHLAADDPEHPLAVTSFRMFNVFGPRQRLDNPYQGVLAIFLGNVLRGEAVTIHSDGEQSRDFVFVGDVCRAWIEAIDNQSTFGRVFNLGSGRPTTVNTLCDTVLGLCGLDRSNHPVHHEPAQPGDIRRAAADVSAIQETLGWQPKISLEEGLEPTVAWARHAAERR